VAGAGVVDVVDVVVGPELAADVVGAAAPTSSPAAQPASSPSTSSPTAELHVRLTAPPPDRVGTNVGSLPIVPPVIVRIRSRGRAGR
jgi:hypothetical protein